MNIHFDQLFYAISCSLLLHIIVHLEFKTMRVSIYIMTIHLYGSLNLSRNYSLGTFYFGPLKWFKTSSLYL